MKKFGTTGMRILKILHLLFAVMWIGGVMALVTIQFGTTPDTEATMMMTITDQYLIDIMFLIPGGIGIVITAIIYGCFTGFGFFKQKWQIEKWIYTTILIVIGAGYMGVILKENYFSILNESTTQFDITMYQDNIRNVAICGSVQLIMFIVVLYLSVFKPKSLRMRKLKD